MALIVRALKRSTGMISYCLDFDGRMDGLRVAPFFFFFNGMRA